VRHGLHIASAFVFAAIVAGCEVGPDYRPPSLPAGATAPLIEVKPKAENSTEAPGPWWDQYGDAQLNALIIEALRANPDLKAAEASLSSAKAELEAAKAENYPGTDVSLGAVRGRDAVTDEILELTDRRPQSIWVFNDILSLSYELDLFGRIRRSVEAAHADAQAVAAARDEVKVAIAAQTARAYAGVCALGEQLAVVRHSVEVTSREAKITGDRHVAGGNSAFDVVRAQAIAAQTQAEVPDLEGQRRAALYELASLLGRTPQFAPTQTLTCETPPQLASTIPVGDGEGLLKRRPDVREAERQLAAATAQIGVATADLYPRITLTGFYGGIAPTLPSLFQESGLTWGVGPKISWSFPNQTEPRARIHQARAEAEAALAHFDSVVLGALEEMEQSLARYNGDVSRRQFLIYAQGKTHAAYAYAQHAFLSGGISSLDVLTSEQAQVVSDAAVASSDADVSRDEIAIFEALGYR
jgi:NodT family efflux transporter outer membrane factor (OMF) lipoprotein